jgi:hypothetical protein
VPIIIVAAALAWWLYLSRPFEDWSKRLIAFLAVLRWTTLFALGVLLLQPYIIQLIEESELPKLLVYVDDSKSVDQIETQSVNTWAYELESEIGDKYEIQLLNFGELPYRIKDSLQKNPFETDLGAVVEGANQDFYGDNIGAVIIASDGIQTKGISPLYVPLAASAPVFVIGMGDSTSQADIEVSDVLVNRIAFINNDIQIKTRVKASKAKGETIAIDLLKNGVVVEQKEMVISTNDQGQEIEFMTRAEQLGQNKITIVASVQENERNILNNRKDAFVDVLDNRTRIKLIANSPHPDVAAIKRSIELSNQYEVSITLFEDWDRNVELDDLFVLHGIPADRSQLNAVKKIYTQGKPSWIILTNQTDLAAFNELPFGLSIEGRSRKSDEITGRINEDFSLFNLPESKSMKRLPPVVAPFGDYRLETDMNIALFQQFGDIETDRPLLAFTSQDGVKHGILTAEGIWRWRMALQSRDNWVESIVRKTVQFLALRQKRTRLEIQIPILIEEQLDVIAKAEAYNESFELTQDADVRLTVSDSNGNEFDYVLRSQGQMFELNLGKLSLGLYSWTANADIGEENFEQTGGFTVRENVSEFQRSRADFNLLNELAARNRGSFYHLSELESVKQRLIALDSARPVIHASNKWSDITELKWLAIVLVLILCLEWFLRKFNGSV